MREKSLQRDKRSRIGRNNRMLKRQEAFNAIDAFLAELNEAEKTELDAADTAIDLAALFYRARTFRQLTQADAAEIAGLRQQAVSRFERVHPTLANTKFETLRRYLVALDFVLEINLRDAITGVQVERFVFGPSDYSVDQRAPATTVEDQGLPHWGGGASERNMVTSASASISWPASGNTLQRAQTPATNSIRLQTGEAA